MKITGQRVVILHNHIFKNAGTTIDWALEKSFGRTFVDHRDDHQMKQGTSYLGQYLIENRHIKALSSHHLPMPLPSLANARVMMIMMLRHPIERVASVYNFEKNQLKSTTPGAIHARKLNLREYIQWRMQPEVGYTIRNFYTHKLLPHKGRAKDAIGEQEMATVMHSAVAIELLGLVERFDESMVLFEHCLRKFFPRIDLSYKIQNVGQETSGNRLERIESIRTEVGEDIFNLLLENNRRDLDLFASVESEIDRRITKVPDFNEKLISFRARCKRYG
ncbi:MAG: sulfotransferase family 2 domain-containing protein [Methylococcaceae bacterium]|nr:sulfotransferase family 2 domain-containing protein [Methylococcaceae bacterium]